MENSEVEKTVASDDGSQLTRNRSFKTKQLVRSQAIREATSPPRTISPSVRSDDSNSNSRTPTNTLVDAGQASDSSHDSDVYSYSDKKSEQGGQQRVEIQITSGSWSAQEPDQSWSSRRSRRWGPGPRDPPRDQPSNNPRDLLSNNPRVACVCGTCSACPQCRGKRRKQNCPTKQDSGIVCSEDCLDCSDTEQNGTTSDIKKSASGSIETDDQFYCRCTERKEKPKNISLSRTDSDDKSEPFGPELVTFIRETLNKNARDRAQLLKIEKELNCLINDPGRCITKFPVMTSYGRMLVHRCASLFQLAHYLDQSNKTCVVVSKSGTSGGRIPCTSFKSWCVASLPPSPARHASDQHNAKSILKRDTHSLDEPSSGANAMSRSKSLEQREREYERVRRRIFSSDESQWPWVNAGPPVKLLTPEPGRNKLLKVQSLESAGRASSWRSAAGSVSKSHSFGGYGDQPAPRALSRQGDLASSSWRLSPSSSGYKTLSLRSTDSVTPSPTGGGTPEPAASSVQAGAGAVVWAVTDIAAVPRGVVLIHPHTGRPVTNADGSVYHYDPSNPPLLYEAADDPAPDNNDKRRGRLEKQHSFMDNDTECQSEDCRNKCCCDYQKQEQHSQQRHLQQIEAPSEPVENTDEKETSKPPPSPIKTYEPNPVQNHTAELTNHSKPADKPTNQKSPEIQQPETANQRYDSQMTTNRSYELANQRELAKMMSQDMVHYNTAYTHPYNSEEMTPPPQLNPYLQQDMSHLQQDMSHMQQDMSHLHQDMSHMQQDMSHLQPALSQGKVAQLHDPLIRPVSLTNMMYPTAMQQTYPTYIPNHRMDQIPQQMYQPLMQQLEDPKPIASPQQENTFRIDPSYPFPAVDYACCDPAQTQHHAQPQRSLGVQYGGGEVPGLMATPYAAPLMLPPTVHHYPVQYQEPLQWPQVQTPAAPKLYDVCPVLYPHHYAHYNVLYPQVLQQPYPLCQPVYPDKPEPVNYTTRRRPSLPAARHTPLSHTPDDKKEEKELIRQDSNEIAVKIQQIKEQMAALNTRGGGGADEARRESQWRRNSGHGILGNYPATYHQPQGRPNEENQLSSAARAIINSLRNMQSKNTYQQDRRSYDNQTYNRSYDRNDNYRNRRDRDGDKPGDRGQGNNPVDRQDLYGKGDGDRRFEPRNRVNQVNLPYRPPYVFRQMSPGTWCRRSPAPVHQTMNHPRRPHPDNRPRR